MSVPYNYKLLYVSAILLQTIVCQCHIITNYCTSVPYNYKLLYVSAILLQTIVRQCHIITNYCTSVPYYYKLLSLMFCAIYITSVETAKMSFFPFLLFVYNKLLLFDWYWKYIYFLMKNLNGSLTKNCSWSNRSSQRILYHRSLSWNKNINQELFYSTCIQNFISQSKSSAG